MADMLKVVVPVAQAAVEKSNDLATAMCRNTFPHKSDEYNMCRYFIEFLWQCANRGAPFAMHAREQRNQSVRTFCWQVE